MKTANDNQYDEFDIPMGRLSRRVGLRQTEELRDAAYDRIRRAQRLLDEYPHVFTEVELRGIRRLIELAKKQIVWANQFIFRLRCHHKRQTVRQARRERRRSLSHLIDSINLPGITTL
jgi:hypothetical protein